MLTLYKALENQVISDNKISDIEKAKCAEIAANIAIDVWRWRVKVSNQLKS